MTTPQDIRKLMESIDETSAFDAARDATRKAREFKRAKVEYKEDVEDALARIMKELGLPGIIWLDSGVAYKRGAGFRMSPYDTDRRGIIREFFNLVLFFSILFASLLDKQRDLFEMAWRMFRINTGQLPSSQRDCTFFVLLQI